MMIVGGRYEGDVGERGEGGGACIEKEGADRESLLICR